MCMQCGCRNHALIVRYMNEHRDVIAELTVLQRAADDGDVDAVRATAQTIAPVLIEHNRSEEVALFPTVRATGKYVDLVDELVADHAYLATTIRAIGAGDAGLVTEFVRRLRNHIHSEDNGIFPGAEFVLKPAQWEDIEAATP